MCSTTVVVASLRLAYSMRNNPRTEKRKRDQSFDRYPNKED